MPSRVKLAVWKLDMPDENIAILEATVAQVFQPRKDDIIEWILPRSSLKTYLTEYGSLHDDVEAALNGTAVMNKDDLRAEVIRQWRQHPTGGRFQSFESLSPETQASIAAAATAVVSANAKEAAVVIWRNRQIDFLRALLTKTRDIMLRTKGSPVAHYNSELTEQRKDPDIAAAKATADEKAHAARTQSCPRRTTTGGHQRGTHNGRSDHKHHRGR